MYNFGAVMKMLLLLQVIVCIYDATSIAIISATRRGEDAWYGQAWIVLLLLGWWRLMKTAALALVRMLAVAA